MVDVIQWVKDHPKTTAAAVVGTLAIGFILMDNDNGNQPIMVQTGVDGQTAVGLAATAAADQANQRQTAAAQQVAEKQIDAAVEVEKAKTEAAVTIANTQATVYSKAIDASTIGQLGINGIIHTVPTQPREVAFRAAGYSGAFGAGGADAWYINTFGMEAFQQFNRENPAR